MCGKYASCVPPDLYAVEVVCVGFEIESATGHRLDFEAPFPLKESIEIQDFRIEISARTDVEGFEGGVPRKYLPDVFYRLANLAGLDEIEFLKVGMHTIIIAVGLRNFFQTHGRFSFQQAKYLSGWASGSSSSSQAS